MSRLFLIGLLLLSAGAMAAPYPLGSMTCADIGQFASEAMSWRKEGRSREQGAVRLALLTELSRVIQTHTQTVSAVLRGSLERWPIR